MIQNIIFTGIIFFLVFVLYKTWENGHKKQSSTTDKIPNKLKFISQKTGRIIEMRFADEHIEKLTEKLKDDAFLMQAEVAFRQITESFSQGNLTTLKKIVADHVYNAFAEQIRLREEKKLTLDFSIICIDSSKIMQKSDNKDEVVVEFISEQINVLKDENGKAVEGDLMNIAKIKDAWTFKKANKGKWLLCATQSEVVYE